MVPPLQSMLFNQRPQSLGRLRSKQLLELHQTLFFPPNIWKKVVWPHKTTGIRVEVGICIIEDYYSLPTGEVLVIQTLTKPQLANPGDSGARMGICMIMWRSGVGQEIQDVSEYKWILVASMHLRKLLSKALAFASVNFLVKTNPHHVRKIWRSIPLPPPIFLNPYLR